MLYCCHVNTSGIFTEFLNLLCPECYLRTKTTFQIHLRQYNVRDYSFVTLPLQFLLPIGVFIYVSYCTSKHLPHLFNYYNSIHAENDMYLSSHNYDCAMFHTRLRL